MISGTGSYPRKNAILFEIEKTAFLQDCRKSLNTQDCILG